MDVSSCSAPFRHWLVRGLVPEKILAEARVAVPPPTWDGWVWYANELEQKRTTRGGTNSLPRDLAGLFRGLCDWGTVAFLRLLTGIPDLERDAMLWGAGLHVSDPGNYLETHLDFDSHPMASGLRRKLNLVLFLNERWEAAWGGAFRLCHPSGVVAKEILPEPGLAVVWEASDLSYHAAGAVAGPEARVTAACYYMAPNPPSATRTRAAFLPRR